MVDSLYGYLRQKIESSTAERDFWRTFINGSTAFEFSMGTEKHAKKKRKVGAWMDEEKNALDDWEYVNIENTYGKYWR